MSTFLYRFDVLYLDSSVSAPASPDVVWEQGQGFADNAARFRAVYHLTNAERPTAAIYTPNVPLVPPVFDGELDRRFGLNERFTYTPAAISHEALSYDAERNSGVLTVSLPLAHPLADLYLREPEALQVWLRLMLPSVSAGVPVGRVVWFGQVVSVEYDEHRAKFTLHNIEKLLGRPGLTAKHPRSCGHILYDRRTCRVRPNSQVGGYFAYREDGLVESVSADGRLITVSAAANRPEGFFSAEGYLVIDGRYTRFSGADDYHPRGVGVPAEGCDVYGGWRRSIVGQSEGGVLTLAVPLPPGDFVGKRVSLYAGCNGSLQACQQVFGNTKNHGGYPFIPIKNAFEVGLKDAAGA